MAPRNTAPTLRWWHDPAGAVDVLVGRRAAVSPEPIVCDRLTLGVYESGAGLVWTRDGEREVEAGEVLSFVAGEVATERRPRSPEARFVALFASPAAVADAFDHLEHAVPTDPPALVRSEPLFAAILRLRAVVEAEWAPVLARGAAWLDVARELCAAYGATPVDGRPPRRGEPRLRAARDYLLDNLSGTVSLDELAEAAGLTKHYLVHAFHDVVGLPPHQYLMRARLSRARELLAHGAPASKVAHECGFADHSHFTRWFTRAFRVSPSLYARREG